VFLTGATSNISSTCAAAMRQLVTVARNGFAV
jgi:hypothetical protein